MSQKNILIIVIIVLLLVGGLLAWYFIQDGTEPVSINTSVVANTNTKEAPAKNTVWIIDGDFNPSVITISSGETITWVNKDVLERQVASDPHPSHTNVTGLESTALELGDDYSFTFTEIGEWFYHDHLNPIKKGAIIVE